MIINLLHQFPWSVGVHCQLPTVNCQFFLFPDKTEQIGMNQTKENIS